MMHGWMDWNHGMGWGGGLFMVVFWVLVVLGLVLVVRLASGRGRTGSAGVQGETALDILKKRYARGEITREEYERMKRDLE